MKFHFKSSFNCALGTILTSNLSTRTAFKTLFLSVLLGFIPATVYAADLDGDQLDSSIETCDGNWVPGVTSGTCDTAASCNANPGCIGTYDYDGDGISDRIEFLTNGTDPSEDDTDNDGVLNVVDNCRTDYNPDQADFDNDGVGDVCDPDTVDTDGDGIIDYTDNCVNVSNPDQADVDNDGIGDLCDPDADPDGDGLQNAYEQSIGTSIVDADTDDDGLDDGMEDSGGTDPLSADSDFDGVHDAADMFPNDQSRILACIPGDANGDGLVNTADLILVQQNVLGTNPLSCQ